MTVSVKELHRIIRTNLGIYLDDIDVVPKGWIGPTNKGYDGHFCIKTVPFNCDCRFEPWVYMHFDNKIIVWPEKDDPKLLDFAHKAQVVGLDPKIIEFQNGMGPAVTWDSIPDGAQIG